LAWQIVCQNGINAGQSYTLDQTPLRFGRSRDNRVVILDTPVSRHHAEIRLEQGNYVIYDLGSRNGTRVNNERIREPQVLQHQDKITIASQVFQTLDLAVAQEPEGEPFPQLLHLKTNEPAETYHLDKLPLTLGRDIKNLVILAGSRASRFHAEIRLTPQGFMVYDLGSRNGTLVNKSRLQQPHLLRHNDRLEIGGETLLFLAEPLSEVTEPQPVNQTRLPATPASQAAPVSLPPGPLAPPQPVPVIAAGPPEYGIKCPGRCGRAWPLYIEHCPIDGYLLANGQSVLLGLVNLPPAKAS
jgi:pSer/pThr/pTyr-binding forkhead associated (FHA) protein